jgi:hypothetical protein
MAVIHISESEATRDLPSLVEMARSGKEVRIESGSEVISISRLRPAEEPRKTLSEAIRLAKERNVDVLLDDQFERDMDSVIRDHDNSGTYDPWRD